MNRLLIVDGHAYAYRAFYAIREIAFAGGPADECHLWLCQDAGEDAGESSGRRI